MMNLVSQDKNKPKHVVKDMVLITKLKNKQIRCFPRSDRDLEFLKPLWRQCLLLNLCAESVGTKMAFHVWVSKPCNKVANLVTEALSIVLYKDDQCRPRKMKQNTNLPFMSDGFRSAASKIYTFACAIGGFSTTVNQLSESNMFENDTLSS